MDFVEADSWEVFRKIDITLSHIYWRPPVYEFVSLIKRHQIITFLFRKSSSSDIFGTLFLFYLYFVWLTNDLWSRYFLELNPTAASKFWNH